mmetsp:Transcript_90562/g.256024  ORF Transcript_90562/g.256024 Transcript_90562/m.256024 type:complete len:358 (-) Transcript_90562:44-1117(-)
MAFGAGGLLIGLRLLLLIGLLLSALLGAVLLGDAVRTRLVTHIELPAQYEDTGDAESHQQHHVASADYARHGIGVLAAVVRAHEPGGRQQYDEQQRGLQRVQHVHHRRPPRPNQAQGYQVHHHHHRQQQQLRERVGQQRDYAHRRGPRQKAKAPVVGVGLEAEQHKLDGLQILGHVALAPCGRLPHRERIHRDEEETRQEAKDCKGNEPSVRVARGVDVWAAKHAAAVALAGVLKGAEGPDYGEDDCDECGLEEVAHGVERLRSFPLPPLWQQFAQYAQHAEERKQEPRQPNLQRITCDHRRAQSALRSERPEVQREQPCPGEQPAKAVRKRDRQRCQCRARLHRHHKRPGAHRQDH